MERNTDTLYIVRFVAATVVILFHYSPPAVGQHIAFVIKNGGEAVNLFFFISGFVLTVSNARFFANRQVKFPVKSFYLKRVARIYPLYILAIALLLLFHFTIKSIDTDTVLLRMLFEIPGIQQWLYSGSFNYPGWSVSCEIFFYLLFPLLAHLLFRYRQAFTWFAGICYVLAIFATKELAELLTSPLSVVAARVVAGLYLNPVLLLPVFLLGMLSGHYFMMGSTPFFKSRLQNILVLALSITVILLVKYFANNGSGLLKGGLLTPVYFVFVLSITGFSRVNTKLFSSKAFLFLGEASYAMYILQYPIYVFYTHYVSPVKTAPALFCFVVILIVLAGLAHLLIEKPVRDAIVARYKRPDLVKERL